MRQTDRRERDRHTDVRQTDRRETDGQREVRQTDNMADGIITLCNVA